MTVRRPGEAPRTRPPRGQGPSADGLRGVRIVIANWRDPWHPEAGGAERYAWEMARALAERGAIIRFLTARAPGQSRGERRDGIEIIRRGGRWTVYPRVLSWLIAHRRAVDAVLDCQNGIPFFTPLVLPRRVPVLCVVHHVHTSQFGVHFPAWVAWVGRLLEGPASRLAYRRQGCVAVSPSTVAAMRERLRWTGDIYLIPNGTAVPAAPPASDAASAGASSLEAADRRPRLVWIGRLVAHKRAELIVPVAARGFSIEVIGRGPRSAALSAAASAVPGGAGAVHLRGYVSEEDKQAIIAESLLHLSTSQGEGWGLCVLEAAALGVPTVAYDVEGLRDAVRDGRTGWLVREGEELADVVERAAKELADPGRRAEVAAACRHWAGLLSWERSTARMARLIEGCVRLGTSRGTRAGAWVVSHDDLGATVAEGPALDVLLGAGGVIVRRATPAERLLGEPGGAAGPP
jgi:glycosyltransferase involved in cell wall biosynthesis